jgi:tRNA (guanine37-N1)-methyltransferase
VRVDIFTIFPGMLEGPLAQSLLGRAIERGLLDVRVHDIRSFADPRDRHRQVDDASYGGGPGMVLKPEPVFAAVEALGERRGRTLLLTPAGRRFDQRVARELAREPSVVLICGRYEGIDERVAQGLPAEELSIGDYVLAGGEAAVLVIVEALARLLPGFLGNPESLTEESHAGGLLEYPVYTRPPGWHGLDVPPVLLSGDHGAIARWRRDESLRRTAARRPDLLAAADLSERDRAALDPPTG